MSRIASPLLSATAKTAASLTRPSPRTACVARLDRTYSSTRWQSPTPRHSAPTPITCSGQLSARPQSWVSRSCALSALILSNGPADDPSLMSITPELDEPLQVLKRNFSFLSKALSTACFRRVWREALDRLQDLLWNSVLLRQSFTTLGAAQFAHDGAAVAALVDRYIPGGSSTLESLREGALLLNLPVDVGGEGDAGAMSLKEASDRAFRDNEQARKVLEELGLRALTPQNARNILEKRVENNENIGW